MTTTLIDPTTVVTREDGSRWRERLCGYCNEFGWFRFQRGQPGRCEACRAKPATLGPRYTGPSSNYQDNLPKRESRSFIYDHAMDFLGDERPIGYLYLADVEKDSDELRQGWDEGVIQDRRHTIGFDNKVWPSDPCIAPGETVRKENIRLGISAAAGQLIGDHGVAGLLLNFDSYGTLAADTASPGPDFVSCLTSLRNFGRPIVGAFTFTRESRRGYYSPAYCTAGEDHILYERGGYGWGLGTLQLPSGYRVLNSGPFVYSSTGVTDMQVVVVGYNPEGR